MNTYLRYPSTYLCLNNQLTRTIHMTFRLPLYYRLLPTTSSHGTYVPSYRIKNNEPRSLARKNTSLRGVPQ